MQLTINRLFRNQDRFWLRFHLHGLRISLCRCWFRPYRLRFCLDGFTHLTVLKSHKSLIDALTHLIHLGRIGQSAHIGLGGDIPQLHQTGWHGSFAKHQEGILSDTIVFAPCCRTSVALYETCQLHALGHVLFVHDLENHHALR